MPALGELKPPEQFKDSNSKDRNSLFNIIFCFSADAKLYPQIQFYLVYHGETLFYGHWHLPIFCQI
jgi:hypothetical protein